MPERLEQHIGTILQMMVLGLLAWTLKSSVETQTDVGILKAKVEALQIAVAQGASEQYSRADAQKEFGHVWAELGRIHNQLERLEARRAR